MSDAVDHDDVVAAIAELRRERAFAAAAELARLARENAELRKRLADLDDFLHIVMDVSTSLGEAGRRVGQSLR